MKGQDRDSSVKLSAKLALPRRDVRDFEVASVMGTWVAPSGHAGPLKRGERAVATTVNRKERQRIIEVLGIGDRTWHNKMSRWVPLHLAHNCTAQIDCLFVEPLEGTAAVCPSCRQGLAPSSTRGTYLHQPGEGPSSTWGMSDHEIGTLTSGNMDIPNKVVQRGEGEGGTGVRVPLQTQDHEHDQEELLTPALAREELAKANSEIRRAEQEAIELVHKVLGDEEESSS